MAEKEDKELKDQLLYVSRGDEALAKKYKTLHLDQTLKVNLNNKGPQDIAVSDTFAKISSPSRFLLSGPSQTGVFANLPKWSFSSKMQTVENEHYNLANTLELGKSEMILSLIEHQKIIFTEEYDTILYCFNGVPEKRQKYLDQMSKTCLEQGITFKVGWLVMCFINESNEISSVN